MPKFLVTAKYFTTTIIDAKNLTEAQEKAEDISTKLALAEELDFAQEPEIVDVERVNKFSDPILTGQ